MANFRELCVQYEFIVFFSKIITLATTLFALLNRYIQNWLSAIVDIFKPQGLEINLKEVTLTFSGLKMI